MILNYLKLAIRLLLRNPFFTMINLVGLAMGFAAFFVLWQHSRSELRSERFISGHDQIYRLTHHYRGYGPYSHFSGMFGNLDGTFAKLLVRTHPDLNENVRFCPQNTFRRFFTGDHDKEVVLVREMPDGSKRSFKEDHLSYADANLFTFFSFPMLRGSAETCLSDPTSMVISQALAKKYFGNEEPIGKTLMINETITVKISGVFADLPGNSHFDFQAVMPLSRIETHFTDIDPAHEANFRLYVRLKDGIDHSILLRRISHTDSLYLLPHFIKWSMFFHRTPSFQPLTDIVFQKVRQDSFEPKSKTLLQIFSWTSLFVLLLGWINYMNLSISSHKRRLKEITARLALGARPRQFIAQFIVEAAVINALAVVLAFTIIQACKIPLERSLNFTYPQLTEIDAQSWVMLVLILATGLIMSGFYPALIAITNMSAKFRALLKLRTSDNRIAQGLTIVQFLIALTLTVWVFTVSRQMNYILLKDLGLAKENVIVVTLPYPGDRSWENEIDRFCRELSKLAQVQDFAVSSSVAGDLDPNGIGLQPSANSPFLGVATNGGIDERFLPFYKIPIIEGRNFLPDHPADKNGIIVSLNALKWLEIPLREAIGKTILVERSAWTHDMRPATIIGVCEDYKHQPLLHGFRGHWSNGAGIALTYGKNLDHENEPKKISVRIAATNVEQTVREIKKRYVESFDGQVFHWTFLDDNINRHYRDETKARNQILIFTLIAMTIAGLGVFGMITNKVIERTKEIGIRKVMGAALQNIAAILVNTTAKQTAISIILGVPLAWFLTQKYLEKFTERIELGWWHFAVPILCFVAILLATISVVIWKAARANPVDSLRYE
jgi:putative ABC transport system permease protein